MKGKQVSEGNMSTITIDLPDETLFQLMLLAHERDITLNKLIESILREYIYRIESNEQLTGCKQPVIIEFLT